MSGGEDLDIRAAFDKGSVTFMGLELAVARGALIPREETTLLGETAVQALRALDADEPRVIDMCCGAGNLACAIAHHVPAARVWASDLTGDCVALARRNAQSTAVAERVAIHQGDLFAALDGRGLEGTIDLIVCNPPYISDKRLEGDRAHLLEHEPREAFAAGPYGLAIHMRVVKDALAYLRPGGLLLFEIGLGQERQVRTLFDRSRGYEDVQAIANAAGKVRVMSGRRKAQPA
jgi:release factor glutamine methyltransferase